ncbi:MAG: hypothetical protein ABSF62_14660 [Bryobacteraceae bacterium]
MDLDNVLAQLRAELENLDAAIVSLECLQTENRRRGRPPKMQAAARKSVSLASGKTGSDPRSVGGHRPD